MSEAIQVFSLLSAHPSSHLACVSIHTIVRPTVWLLTAPSDTFETSLYLWTDLASDQRVLPQCVCLSVCRLMSRFDFTDLGPGRLR
jgi:hypothetical protein